MSCPFFTTSRKRPFVRGTEMSLSKWLSKEVNARKDIIIELKDSNSPENIAKREKAWTEIETMASIRFGEKVDVQELKDIWARDCCETSADSPGSSQSSSSPIVDQSLQVVNPSVKVEIGEEEVENKKRKKILPESTQKTTNSNVYRIVIREVLRRSTLLIDKSNAKSRTPQANQARWTAWNEIRQIILNECQRLVPVDQLQLLWRHQKAKVPFDIFEKAFKDPQSIDDQIVERIYRCEEKERFEIQKEDEMLNAMKEFVQGNILAENEKQQEATTPIQISPSSNAFFMLPATQTSILPTMISTIQPALLSMSSLDQSINAVVRSSGLNSALEDRKFKLMEQLVAAQLQYFEQMSTLREKEIEVMNNFQKMVQKILEK